MTLGSILCFKKIPEERRTLSLFKESPEGGACLGGGKLGKDLGGGAGATKTRGDDPLDLLLRAGGKRTQQSENTALCTFWWRKRKSGIKHSIGGARKKGVAEQGEGGGGVKSNKLQNGNGDSVDGGRF